MTLPGQRFTSLDVLRGAAVALMIVVNNPGSWQHLYPPLAHAAWHGVTPTDLVFPLFLFAVGNALALTLSAQREAGAAAFGRWLLRRTLLIFGLGLLLNAAPFVRWNEAGELVWRDWGQLRWMGVLQRIALAWAAAALIVRWGGRRGAWWACVLLLAGYWAACVALAAPGADPYSLEGFFGTAIDRQLLGAGHLYKGEGVPFDPEGLASTLPAVAQVLIGYLAADALQRGHADARTLLRLFAAATLLLALAWAWQGLMPLNKKIWTSSYVLHTSAIAMLLLALLVLAIEGVVPGPPGPWRGSRSMRFFEVFGRNALFIFVLSGLLPRLAALLRWPDGVDAQGRERFVTLLPWLHRTLFEPLTPFDPRLGSLLFALAQLAGYWALARWLDARRIYIRV